MIDHAFSSYEDVVSRYRITICAVFYSVVLFDWKWEIPDAAMGPYFGDARNAVISELFDIESSTTQNFKAT